MSAAKNRHTAKLPNDVISLYQHEFAHSSAHSSATTTATTTLSYNQRTLRTSYPTTIHNPQPIWGLLTSIPLPSSTSSYVRARCIFSPGLTIPISVRLAVINPSSLTSTQSGVGLARSVLSIDSLPICRFSLNYPPRRVIHISHYTLLCYTSSRLLDFTLLTHFVIRSYPPFLQSSLSNQTTRVLYLPAWTPTHSKK